MIRGSTHPERRGRHWALVGRLLRRRSGRLAVSVLVASLIPVLSVLAVYLLHIIFDQAAPGRNAPLLLAASGAILAVRVGGAGAALLHRHIVLSLSSRVTFELRTALLASLYRLSLQALSKADTDEIHARIVQDTERVDAMLNALLSSLPNLLSAVVLAAYAASLNLRLSLSLFALTPVIYLLNRFGARLVRRHTQACQRAFEAFHHGVFFVLRHVQLTRLQDHVAGELARQRDMLTTLQATSRSMAMSFTLQGQIHTVVSAVATVVVVIVGGLAIIDGAMTIGDFIAFFVTASMLNAAVGSLLNAVPALVSGDEGLKKLHALLSAGPPEPYTGDERVDFNGVIAMRDISFAYDGANVLEGFDLDLRPGVVTGLAGSNGAGKTTVLQLILGQLRPSEGGITASGVHYERLDISALRGSIGFAPQHPQIFSGSVRDNVAYGRPAASDHEIIAALSIARMDDFVAGLPHGLDTQVGDGGAMLSGGERQRLAIARAVLGAPRLLIFDEPTNHIDAASVNLILDAIVAHPAGPAILVVSHDPNVMARAAYIHDLDAAAGGVAIADGLARVG